MTVTVDLVVNPLLIVQPAHHGLISWRWSHDALASCPICSPNGDVCYAVLYRSKRDAGTIRRPSDEAAGGRGDACGDTPREIANHQSRAAAQSNSLLIGGDL